MKRILISAVCLAIAACSGVTEPLTVKQYTLRDQTSDPGGDPMARNEKLRRLHGAVSLEERKQRLGQYYTVLWNDTEGAARNREILFQYQQGGSKVKTVRRALPDGETSGKEEFSILGDDYFKNGRVLAWKIDFLGDGKTIASKQSYLWE